MRRLELEEDRIDELIASIRGEPGDDEELRRTVADIVADVRRRGDAALVELTRRFDDPGFSAERIRVEPEAIQAAVEATSAEIADAVTLAAENLRLFHQHELKGDWTASMRQGQVLGQRLIPVGRAGLYVPGGGAEYPSTVVMTAVPAQVAGVEEIFICTPAGPGGEVSRAVLAAAGIMGIDEVYRVGGAQAVAAMAWGTESIRPADVVCGPGNRFVAEAKRQVYGRVGIDSLAGPSEVLIIADEGADGDLAAADLLAQVEHGSGAVSVLVCWSPELLDTVTAAIERLAAELDIGEEATGRITLLLAGGERPQEAAVRFSNAFAPEHLELFVEHPEQMLHEITAAGAVFLGEDVCAAFGDYTIGSNHVLPTGGTARFASGLSVENFQKKVAVISLNAESIGELAPPLASLAELEGLACHARAALMRLDRFGVEPGEG